MEIGPVIMDVKIEEGWKSQLKDEFDKPYFAELVRFVKEEYRKRGLARDMLEACQKWAKEQGCAEFASDCELDNEASLKFHMKMEFVEANRIICFTKKLN